ncbi:M23 family metallopeptidase [Blastococcus goldschmidtiae]|uniref:M23 family metallopeptidase n=1 Tax=Blastococcus goldschmidtiae TaxID=3075546 RepID=A0ABU2K5C7_9ACTN|nr:M23 family metallopeptidase [Blastococcus sp. DSM 46792]MDT0275404.1 M23 family metallopeptidase [Blastococcus sp. DSM 46792]
MSFPGAVSLALPFRGTWLVRNSPARRRDGTELFATTYAIDFVAVEGRRTAATRSWRTLLGTEPPELFVAFGQPVLAPAAGTVVSVLDGEADHEARRSQLALVPYALTQAGRIRGGPAAIAGNHVVLELADGGGFVLLAHLRRGSVTVAPGRRVAEGEQLGACGNSGNSTQPHVHLQVMDDADASRASGLPVEFRSYRVRPRSGGQPVEVARGVPGESEVVEPR